MLSSVEAVAYMLLLNADNNAKAGGYNIPKGSIVVIQEFGKTLYNFGQEDVDMKGHDYRLLLFGSDRRVCPGTNLAINLVTSMLAHLLHHFVWSLPIGVKVEDVDMMESPVTVTYMQTPLHVVPTPRLPLCLFTHVK
ncbi:hypothetical protein RND71_004405 [Anisodus tanguticus]|uniref:Uncharacterized protein n=1 Tax=Anisodus tanguticus TaxID=243964 RepID=A0AAE1SY95_9SOLA|nr:hypothetical protein RND71_004405 [Anisodus tanguticus]